SPFQMLVKGASGAYFSKRSQMLNKLYRALCLVYTNTTSSPRLNELIFASLFFKRMRADSPIEYVDFLALASAITISSLSTLWTRPWASPALLNGPSPCRIFVISRWERRELAIMSL